ncbi:hypothetical protein DFS33DRAFT_618217 [Desarmillaria ectypa]|nr:hypothetical protein DFS33DRAFT_618217 [Desarmillaria ectypa]
MKSGFLCSNHGKRLFHSVFLALFLTSKMHGKYLIFQVGFANSFLPLEVQTKCRLIFMWRKRTSSGSDSGMIIQESYLQSVAFPQRSWRRFYVVRGKVRLVAQIKGDPPSMFSLRKRGRGVLDKCATRGGVPLRYSVQSYGQQCRLNLQIAYAAVLRTEIHEYFVASFGTQS